MEGKDTRERTRGDEATRRRGDKERRRGRRRGRGTRHKARDGGERTDRAGIDGDRRALPWLTAPPAAGPTTAGARPHDTLRCAAARTAWCSSVPGARAGAGRARAGRGQPGPAWPAQARPGQAGACGALATTTLADGPGTADRGA